MSRSKCHSRSRVHVWRDKFKPNILLGLVLVHDFGLRQPYVGGELSKYTYVRNLCLKLEFGDWKTRAPEYSISYHNIHIINLEPVLDETY